MPTDIKERIKDIIRNVDVDRQFTSEQKAILTILWKSWGKRFSQRQLAQSEPWIGCHPEHEADIYHGKFDTTTRQVRQIIRDLRIGHRIPILADRAGYWLPETQEECDQYMKDMELRAKAQAKAAVETFNAMSEATGITSEFIKKLNIAIA